MNRTILIVEDNEMNMRLFDDLLRAHGYDTVKSVNGMDVVELAREHSPDLIIMDILLPVLSGIELTRMLKSEIDLKSIPVIALTASVMKGGEEIIFEAGCDAFITKPVSISLLLDSWYTMRETLVCIVPIRLVPTPTTYGVLQCSGAKSSVNVVATTSLAMHRSKQKALRGKTAC